MFKTKQLLYLIAFYYGLFSIVKSVPVRNRQYQTHSNVEGNPLHITEPSSLTNAKYTSLANHHYHHSSLGYTNKVHIGGSVNNHRHITPPKGLVELSTLPITHSQLKKVDQVTQKMANLKLNE